MSVDRRWIFAPWLACIAAAAAGGWMVGRQHVVANNPRSENHRIASKRSEYALPTNSPKGKWSERVKQANPAAFPRLMEEWHDLFPESEDGNNVQRENALRWLFAEWLVNDPDGFMKTVMSEDFEPQYSAIPVIVQFKPDLAIRLLNSSEHSSSIDLFVYDLAEELAKAHPILYLKLNPDGTREFPPDTHRASESWQNAIAALAQSDPVAAANAWQKRKLENNVNEVLESLLPVLAAWKDDDSAIKNWVNQIENSELRELAQQARLMTLAKRDAHTALAELYTTHLQPNNDLRITAPREVLTQLAQQDLPAAIRLLKKTSPLFALPREDFEVKSNSALATPAQDQDPFASPLADSPSHPSDPSPPPSRPPPNPFIALAPYVGNTPDHNWMRTEILSEASQHLPENPDQLVAAIQQLRSATGDDSPWQRKIEAELIRYASGNLSIESSLALTQMWNNELGGKRDDETYRSLASKIATTDPDRAEAMLESLPETARAAFAAEIVKNLPPEDVERRIRLLGQLTPAQWNEDLGKSLGEHPADYADAIAALPGTTTAGGRKAFMEKWVENDPTAATRWFSSLPKDEAAGPAAVGLFNGWSNYDKSSAVAWAESLSNSPARQAVALDVVHAIANRNPGDAWRWALFITDPTHKAQAYNVISVSRDDIPEEFKKEHKAALDAAGME